MLHSTRSVLVSVSLALLGLGSGAQAQADWTQLKPAILPPKRSDHAMTADQVGMWFFGGRPQPGNFVINDTWRFLAGTWSQVTTATLPEGRWQTQLAWDASRSRLVMFGGRGLNGDLDDTWELVNNDWAKITTTNKPAARWRHRMVYDSARRHIVMYGGQAGTATEFDDTWTYDGKDWKLLTPATKPPMRRDHPMTYDSTAGVTVLFGGRTGSVYLNDTWTFDGVNWKQLNPTASPPGWGTAHMAYDAGRDRTVLFAGLKGGPMVNETWELDLSTPTWVQRTPATSPVVRSGAPVVYVDLGQQIYVYGGFNSTLKQLDDFWKYQTDKPASFSTAGTGCAGAAGTPSLDGTRPWLGADLVLTATNVPPTGPTSVFVGTSDAKWGAITLPLNLAFMGAPTCNLMVEPLFLFGMPTSGGVARLTLPLPSLPVLAGVKFYTQAFAADASANAAGIVVSNYGIGTAGLR